MPYLNFSDCQQTRYTPAQAAFDTGNIFDILGSAGGDHEYLELNDADKTFTWTSNRNQAATNANAEYPNSEGITICNRKLYFVSKSRQECYILDLDNLTYTIKDTVSGPFDNDPDQISRMHGDCNTIFFAEDGGTDCDGKKGCCRCPFSDHPLSPQCAHHP